MSRPRVVLALSIVVLAISAVSSADALVGSRAGTATTSELVTGRQLYRQFCGKCHALAAALSAGFGNAKGGLGDLGGPSFNELRVPYSYSVQAVTEPTGGHEIVRRRINPKQLKQVSLWLAKVTRSHPIPALPTDG